MIYIDTQGTILDNRDLSKEDCIKAVQDLSDAGHQVRVVSSAPGGELAGRPIGDKSEILRTLGPGDFLVDDHLMTLVAACRLGCATVPASQLCSFADLLCPSRR